MIKLKRIYEKPAENDGFRVLVDRLWPRGVSKEKAALDLWLKDIAPTDMLRKWFSHDIKKWADFRKKYKAELDKNPKHVKELKQLTIKGTVTLLYAAKDEEHNQAAIIREYISK